MTGIDVVAHKAACASLVARGQMLLITRYQGALFGFPAGVARRPRCPLCFLAVGGYEGVKAGGLGLLALRRGATFLPSGVVETGSTVVEVSSLLFLFRPNTLQG